MVIPLSVSIQIMCLNVPSTTDAIKCVDEKHPKESGRSSERRDLWDERKDWRKVKKKEDNRFLNDSSLVIPLRFDLSSLGAPTIGTWSDECYFDKKKKHFVFQLYRFMLSTISTNILSRKLPIYAWSVFFYYNTLTAIKIVSRSTLTRK